MIDLQILGTVPRPGKWNWSFGIWFYRKLSGSPRDEKIKHFAKYKCWNFLSLLISFPILVNVIPYQIYIQNTQITVFNFFPTKLGALPILQECPYTSSTVGANMAALCVWKFLFELAELRAYMKIEVKSCDRSRDPIL